jgi:hypothetical protein
MARIYRLPHAAGERDPHSRSASVQPDRAVVGRVKELTKNLLIRRQLVITAGCALLVRGRSANGSELVDSRTPELLQHQQSRALGTARGAGGDDRRFGGEP